MPIVTPDASSGDFPEYELTLSQFKAMTVLQKGPQRMSDIARHLDMSLSSVTNMVGRLEGKKLVQRTHDTADRRVVTCELTEEGLNAVTWIWQMGRRGMLAISELLEDDELDQLIRAFEILVNAARRAGDENPNE